MKVVELHATTSNDIHDSSSYETLFVMRDMKRMVNRALHPNKEDMGRLNPRVVSLE